MLRLCLHFPRLSSELSQEMKCLRNFLAAEKMSITVFGTFAFAKDLMQMMEGNKEESRLLEGRSQFQMAF